jgi:hypothetical protein
VISENPYTKLLKLIWAKDPFNSFFSKTVKFPGLATGKKLEINFDLHGKLSHTTPMRTSHLPTLVEKGPYVQDH